MRLNNHLATMTPALIAGALFAFAAILLPLSAFALTETVDGIEWTFTVSDGEASVGSGSDSGNGAVPTSTTGAISIPPILGNHPVTSVGDCAFLNCSNLTSITIPDGVTSIGEWAFAVCSELTSIAIPGSVTNIGKYAFCQCSGLTTIPIPDDVTRIGNSAFSGCSGLTSITIPDGVTIIGTWLFSGCSGLTSITIPDSVEYILMAAFQGCSGLTSITIPESFAGDTDSWGLPSGCQVVVYDNSCVGIDGVLVPKTWISGNAADALAAADGNYWKAARTVVSNGVDMVWQCYVSGVCPTNAAELFEARIGFENGGPIVSWTPDLNEGGTKNERVYTVEGKANLGDESWGPTNEATRFFRVKVSMP